MIITRKSSSMLPKMRRFFIFGQPDSFFFATGGRTFLAASMASTTGSNSLSDGSAPRALEGDALRRATAGILARKTAAAASGSGIVVIAPKERGRPLFREVVT